MDFTRTVNVEYSNKIYDILVEECGASDGEPDDPRQDRWSFCRYLAEDANGYHEWRFCGNLGFGGKFKNTGNRWYVTCYGEDDTPERSEMIRKADVKLEVLREVYVSNLTSE